MIGIGDCKLVTSTNMSGMCPGGVRGVSGRGAGYDRAVRVPGTGAWIGSTSRGVTRVPSS